MSEEDYKETAPNEPEPQRMRVGRRTMYVLLGLIVVVIISALLFWILRSRESGQTVSTPTGVNFGDNTSTVGDSIDVETITIQPDQVDKIGLQIVTVGETLSDEAMSVAATGVVQPNAYQETPVFALLGGVIRSVKVELGQKVGVGQIVAIANSDELASAASAYVETLAEADEANSRYDRALKLTDIAQESRTELDQATSAVTIAEAEHAEHQSHYARSQKLLAIGAVSREEFDMVRSKHDTAKANLIEANRRLERAKRLLEINPQRRAELDSALTMKRSSEANASAAREKLLVYGLLRQDADRIKSTRKVTSELAIRSPVSGTVTLRNVNLGEIIAANKELLRITNLGKMWVIAQVYESDIDRLRIGSGASVTTQAFPGKLFRGKVTYIDPNIDQSNRTAQVRVELNNPGQILKIGMYVNVAFGSMGVAEKTMPAIPVSAVQNMNDRKIVFAITDKPNVFAVRTVRLGVEDGGQYVVFDGLNVGDRVVTEGSFLLRAELVKQGSGPK